MKYLFLLCLALLVAATVVTGRFEPAAQSKVPIIYWLTDPNPARVEQIARFQAWMKRVHPGVQCQLLVDSANDDPTKSEIQAVSGVGDDVMDQGGAGIRFFQAMGAIRDLGSVDDMQSLAREHGFGPDKTYPALLPEISIPQPDGSMHQYAFPCNVNASMMFLNRNTFLKYGLQPPPMHWTLDDFEKLGIALNQAANPDQSRRQVFITDAIPMYELQRTLGGNNFNETDTRCILDSAADIEALKLAYKFTNIDHILPNAVEQTAQATESGYGGSDIQLFNQDQYGMIYTGRYMLIQFRKFDVTRKSKGLPLLNYGVSEMPSGGFPVSILTARSATIYAAAKYPELAEDFLEFLTSREYNEQVVDGADALPPNPKFVNEPEFVNPKGHPNEAGISTIFADAAIHLAIAPSYSPFVLEAVYDQNLSEARDMFMNDQLTAEQAGRQGADRVNYEIQRTLREDPSLLPWYNRLLTQQAQIEANRAAGKKVPLSLIPDPFWKRYYVAKGWSDPN